MRNAPHRFSIVRPTTVDVIDGRPVYEWSVLATVSGWFSLLDAEESPLWESQTVTASARIPTGVAITTRDRLKVLSPASTSIEGWWQIVTVRFHPVHLRAMLRLVA